MKLNGGDRTGQQQRRRLPIHHEGANRIGEGDARCPGGDNRGRRLSGGGGRVRTRAGTRAAGVRREGVEERSGGEMRKSIYDKEEKRKNIERASELVSNEHSTLPCPAPLSGDGAGGGAAGGAARHQILDRRAGRRDGGVVLLSITFCTSKTPLK